MLAIIEKLSETNNLYYETNFSSSLFSFLKLILTYTNMIVCSQLNFTNTLRSHLNNKTQVFLETVKLEQDQPGFLFDIFHMGEFLTV